MYKVYGVRMSHVYKVYGVSRSHVYKVYIIYNDTPHPPRGGRVTRRTRAPGRAPAFAWRAGPRADPAAAQRGRISNRARSPVAGDVQHLGGELRLD